MGLSEGEGAVVLWRRKDAGSLLGSFSRYVCCVLEK